MRILPGTGGSSGGPLANAGGLAVVVGLIAALGALAIVRIEAPEPADDREASSEAPADREPSPAPERQVETSDRPPAAGLSAAGAAERPNAAERPDAAGDELEEGSAEAGSDAEPRSLTIAATGDVLIHSPVYRQAAANAETSERAYDFRPMFEQVADTFAAADLSVCHLEGPLSRDNTDLGRHPRRNAPRELAHDLAWANVDACSTASNHTLDRAMEGVVATLDVLDAAGVDHAGSHRSPEEAARPRLHEVAGVTVGHVAATYGLNGAPRPEPWVVDLLGDDRLADRAGAARDAGAELVVASLHWGREYVAEPTARQRAVAHQLLEDGTVDVILGHHAHVVQPIEQIDGRPVAYGLGNFLSNQSAACCPPETQDGMIGVVEVTEALDEPGWDTELAYVPTWVDRDDYTVVDVGAALGGGLDAGRRAQLEQSRERTRSVVGSDGVDEIVGPELEARADHDARRARFVE